MYKKKNIYIYIYIHVCFFRTCRASVVVARQLRKYSIVDSGFFHGVVGCTARVMAFEGPGVMSSAGYFCRQAKVLESQMLTRLGTADES